MNHVANQPLIIDALIDTICDRFEDAWRLGLRPDLAVYLGETIEPARETLVRQLLEIEWEQRRSRGERPSSKDYVGRYPELRSLILEFEAHTDATHATVDYSADSSLPTGPSTTDWVREAPGGRFQVKREWARGGLGLVSVAVDHQLGREVALKELQPAWAGQPDRRMRFINEARITGMLEHPGIVPIYALETRPDGTPYYAMKLVRGDNLRAAINDFQNKTESVGNPVELRRLLSRLVDVCHAVNYAHHRGIVHRDIKPENILLGEYGETLLVDWGLAKQAAETDQPAPAEHSDQPNAEASTETLEGTVVGTPGYMAPEQANGRTRDLGPACDIYGLGATLYCILTGRPPHVADDKEQALEHARHGTIDPPRRLARRVPRPLEAICLKALEPLPQDRYGSAQAMVDDLERWLADEPVEAYPEPLPERLSRWSRRNRSWVRVAGVALALVTMVSLWAAITVGQSRDREARAKEAAQENLKRAELNLVASLSAVEKMLVRVGADELVVLPHSESVRLELLEDAQELLSSVFATEGDDPRVRIQAATVSRRIAEVAMWLGEFSRAESATRKAMVWLDAIEPEARAHSLARIASTRANLFQLMGRTGDAEVEFDLAIKRFEALPRQTLDQPHTRLERAHLEVNFGDLCEHFGRLDEAKTHYLTGIDQLNNVTFNLDDERYPLYELTRANHGLARTLRALGEHDKVAVRFQTAMKFAERLCDREHCTPMERSLRASVSGGYAWMLVADGDHVAAEAELRRSLGFHEQLAAEFGRVAKYQLNLASANANLAWFLAQPQPGVLQEYGEFIEPFKNEIDVRYQQAIQTLDQLRDSEPDVADYLASLSNTCNNYGIFLGTCKDIDAALSLLDRTTVLRRDAIERFGPTPGRYSELAAVLHNTSELRAAMGHTTRAAQEVLEAIECEERALDANPEHPDYQSFLRNHYWLLARIRECEGNHAQAARAYLQAIDIAERGYDSATDKARHKGYLNGIAGDYAMLLTTTGQADVADIDAALVRIDGCRQRSPGWPGYHVFGAWILIAADQLTDAEAALDEARQLLDEPDVTADLVEAYLAWKLHQPARSRAALERARAASAERGMPTSSNQALEHERDRRMLSIVERLLG